MPERIYKLQPNRTLALRGFDHLGASAAIHSATATEFKVSGVFRDPADFAVLVLHDADNFYEHPRLKYLPDFSFGGLTLTFDVQYQGLMPIDSPKYPTIDWPFLDVIRKDGSSAEILLSDNAVPIGTPKQKAKASFTLIDDGFRQFDRVTLWYLNLAFDYLVPKVDCTYEFFAAGAGTVHTVTVAGTPYSYTEAAGDSSAAVAAGVAAALAPCTDVRPIQGDGTPELGPAHALRVRAAKTDGSETVVSSGGATDTIYGVGVSTVATELARQINSTNWGDTGALIELSALATGPTIEITASVPGYDGNLLAMYAVAKNTRLRTQNAVANFTGGTEDATLRVTINFAALGIPDIRLMWLTFAPPLSNAQAFESLEWQASFTNWTLSGPEPVKVLQVAGPLSIRVEENDSWCSYSGSWSVESGFFSEGFARRSNAPDSTVTVKYVCMSPHDLYIGTSLYKDRGAVFVQLDGDAATRLNCYLDNEPSVNTRRKVRTAVPAGEHTVTIRAESAAYFYFDFLEAVVASDVPDPVKIRANVSPALDYSTDHTYKLAPARVLWNFDKLGFQGPMNEYLGVFWWNQRVRQGGVFPQVQVTFGGVFNPDDLIVLNIGGQECRKTVFPNETLSTFALHFAQLINAQYVGVWAQAAGSALTITTRSPEPAYSYSFSCHKQSATGSTGTVTHTGALTGGVSGKWFVDPTQSPALNRGAREWHLDMFRGCAARNREIVIAASMELVNPPSSFGAVYYNGTIVATDVGFASMKSTHCAFVNAMLDYQKQVYKCVGDLMVEAGIRPNLQFGEFLWWFFTNFGPGQTDGGMAFYHPEIQAAAQAALGRPLVRFKHPNDNPQVNGGADALFLRNRLRDHVNSLVSYLRSNFPNARIELLFPYDVNHPHPAGIHELGGRLNRYINMPVEWESKATSNLDAIKMEALDFGAWCRDLDLAKTAIVFPLDLGWPRDSVRHLVPVFRGGYPWEKEVAIAEAQGVEAINLWAFDHVCIFGWSPHPVGNGRSVMQG